MDRAREIAEGLTDTQRDEVREGRCIYGPGRCMCASMHKARFAELGLIDPHLYQYGDGLTEIGCAVQAILKEQDDGK